MNSLCVMPHDGDRPEAEVGFLCAWDRKRMTRLVADVRDLWVDTAFIVEAGTAPKDDTPHTKHTKAAEAPAPANLEVLSLRDNRTRYQRIAPTPAVDDSGDESEPLPPVMEMIGSWVMVVAEERPLAPSLLPRSTIAQLNLLLRHGDWIAAQPWVDDYLGELGDLRKTLAAAVRDHTHRKVGACKLPDLAKAQRCPVECDDDCETDCHEEHQVPQKRYSHQPADCPSRTTGICGGVLLQENGSDVIRCRSCGAAWVTPQERARLAISLETA